MGFLLVLRIAYLVFQRRLRFNMSHTLNRVATRSRTQAQVDAILEAERSTDLGTLYPDKMDENLLQDKPNRSIREEDIAYFRKKLQKIINEDAS